MAARKVRAIIFDIGRVLIRIDVARAMKGMASGTSLSPEELWLAIAKDPRWTDWQADPIHVAYMESRYDFFSHFPVRIYSCAIGAAKPNPLIYKEALRACRVRAEEAVYVDDIAAYAEAAQRLGMAGIQFQSSKQLALAFQELGLET